MLPAAPRSRRTVAHAIFLCLLATVSAHAQDVWLGGAGVWTNGAKWSLGRPPLSSEDCLIDNGNSLVSNVTDNTTAQCNNFTLDPTDTLGLGNSSNPNSSLSLFGASFTNRGKITLNQSSRLTMSGTGTQTLSGGGSITLNTATTAINGSGSTVMNVDNTIKGQGSLGQGTINIVNQGTISASGGTLTVQGAGNGVTNLLT